MNVGDSEGLLQGYVKIETSRGHNFDARGTLAVGILVGIVGTIAATLASGEEEREEHEEDEPEKHSLHPA